MRRRIAKGSIRLSRSRRWSIYGVALGLWATGAGWLLLHYFLTRSGPFGPEPHPLGPWALRAHGALAFAGLWLGGLLWAAHIVNGWSARRRRWSGAVLSGFGLLLIATGYLLYYAGDDQLRAWISPLHWLIGLAAPVVFLAHRFAREHAEIARKAGAKSGKRAGPPSSFPAPQTGEGGLDPYPVRREAAE